MQRSTTLLTFLLLLWADAVHAVPPAQWNVRGLGGGGALYAPILSPHNGEIYLASDMGHMLHSTDVGATWGPVHFLELQGNRTSRVCFTNDPSILYAGDATVFTGGGVAPSKSTDGGTTWTPLVADPTHSTALALHCDSNDASRVLVADRTTLYASTDGGASFAPKFTTADTTNGVHVAGALFDGQDIYVGTSKGLLVSHDGGASFSPDTTPGIGASEVIVGFAGAREGALVRLLAITASSFVAGADPASAYASYQKVYRLDWGQPSWTVQTSGLASGEGFSFIAMAANNAATAYLAGVVTSSKLLRIYKTTNGGGSWQSTFTTLNNQSVASGWNAIQTAGGSGRWWGDWSTIPFALTVAPNDAQRAAFTDGGFLHVSNDGGGVWNAAYIPPGERNAPGALAPNAKAYTGNGLENTAVNWVFWEDALHLLTGYVDIQGTRSSDGGVTWAPYGTNGGAAPLAPPPAPDGLKDIYQIIRHPNGTIYAAASAPGALYKANILTDSLLDSPGGRVLFTTNHGVTWSTLHDFQHGVAGIAFDPNDGNTLYASVINSTQGGIYVSHDIQNGSSSTWTPLPRHVRANGHPLDIFVLSDGTLVSTHSARRTGSPLMFETSSGVFVWPPGAAGWSDRSAPEMYHYTKHLSIDPTNDNIWYVGTQNSWGGNAGNPNIAGGLYRTIDRGQSWTKLLSVEVESATVNPNDSNELYVATLGKGLWYSSDVVAQAPAQLSSYPFRSPQQVFFNPHTPEVWVASFGNGIQVGAIPTPTATASVIPTVTPTTTASASPSSTASPTDSPLPTHTATSPATATTTASATVSPSPTANPSATESPTVTASPSATESPTVTASETPSGTVAPSPSPSATASPTGLCSSGATLQKSRVQMSLTPSRLSFRGEAVLPKPWNQVDPLTWGLRFVIDDATGNASIDAIIPAGAVSFGSGWTLTGGGSKWKFQDAGGANAGITRVVVKDLSAKQDGLLRVSIKGHANSGMLPDVNTVHAVVSFGPDPECAAIQFNAPAGAAPNCTLNNKLQCR